MSLVQLRANLKVFSPVIFEIFFHQHVASINGLPKNTFVSVLPSVASF